VAVSSLTGTPTQKFEVGGPFCGNNYNARNKFDNMYIEGGSVNAWPGPRDTVFGGLQQSLVDRSRGALIIDENILNYVQTQGVRVSPGGGGNFSSRVSLGGNGDAVETILGLSNYEGHSVGASAHQWHRG
jgi:hypothetical protein